MRLEVIEPQELTAQQEPLYQDMKKGIEASFKGIKAIRKNGALIGPWNPCIRFPRIGEPMWELVKALSIHPTLPKPVREIAILVTGVRDKSSRFSGGHRIGPGGNDQG